MKTLPPTGKKGRSRFDLCGIWRQTWIWQWKETWTSLWPSRRSWGGGCTRLCSGSRFTPACRSETPSWASDCVPALWTTDGRSTRDCLYCSCITWMLLRMIQVFIFKTKSSESSTLFWLYSFISFKGSWTAFPKRYSVLNIRGFYSLCNMTPYSLDLSTLNNLFLKLKRGFSSIKISM